MQIEKDFVVQAMQSSISSKQPNHSSQNKLHYASTSTISKESTYAYHIASNKGLPRIQAGLV